MSTIRSAAAMLGVCLLGCTSTVPLDQAVVAYDITTTAGCGHRCKAKQQQNPFGALPEPLRPFQPR